MRFYKKSVAILLGAILLFFLEGCASSVSDPLAFRRETAVLCAEGDWGGISVSCDIYCENGNWNRICFLSPNVLADACVTREEGGEIRVEKEGISASFSEASFCFRPDRVAEVLMTAPLTVESVQGIEKGKILSLKNRENGMLYTLTLGEDGFPTFLSGEDFSVRLIRKT